QVFTHDMKPMEVEILVAEVTAQADDDQLFHILYDGTVFDEDRFTVLGGEADAITQRMEGAYTVGASLADALRAAVTALAGPDRTLSPKDLEVAVLTRGDSRRAFRRIEDDELATLLG
nr:proteasome subunit alpha [Actinomycetota bacterium]